METITDQTLRDLEQNPPDSLDLSKLRWGLKLTTYLDSLPQEHEFFRLLHDREKAACVPVLPELMLEQCEESYQRQESPQHVLQELMIRLQSG